LAAYVGKTASPARIRKITGNHAPSVPEIIPLYARRDPMEKRRKLTMNKKRLAENAATFPCFPVDTATGKTIKG
jgi:hypothetical protein